MSRLFAALPKNVTKTGKSLHAFSTRIATIQLHIEFRLYYLVVCASFLFTGGLFVGNVGFYLHTGNWSSVYLDVFAL